jgi:chitinase
LYKDVTVQPASAPNPSEPGNGSSCHETWKASQAYATAGQLVTYNGRNYKNKWWTQGEDPASVGQWGVWEDVGACAQ